MSATSERGSHPSANCVDSVILPHPVVSPARVLLIHHDSGSRIAWSLPSLASSERHFWQTTVGLNRLVAEEFGVRAVALRCVSIEEDGECERFVYEMDTLACAAHDIDNSRWVTLADLKAIEIEPPADRALIERWLIEQTTGAIPTLRPAWSRRGWFADAIARLESLVASQRRTLHSPIEQLRTWGRSTVLRAPTSSGDVYLKVVPAVFAHEVAVTRFLEKRHPNSGVTLFPAPVEPDWLLMEALPGTPLEEIKELGAWERALESLARLQIDLIPACDDLRALGCPERSLSGLRDALLDIASDDELQLLGRDGGLTIEQSGLLSSGVPNLQAACDELASLSIPSSLDHGDLHPGNVVVGGLHDRFFDWSDCAISHPFFSLVLYYEDTAGALEQDETTRSAIRAAYQKPWVRLLPETDLLRAFELAQLLAPIAYAWTYQSQVLPGLEQQWEMHRMAPHYLRTALKRLSE